MASKLGSNPLLKKRKNLHLIDEEEKLELRKEVISHYGRLEDITEKLLKKVDFEDTDYINRLKLDSKSLELEELKKSIEKIGLLNIVYLKEKTDGSYTIISGLRRLSSLKELAEEGTKIDIKDRVIILSEETPVEFLDLISVDENTKRKNLTILEQSYKFNREATKKHKKIDTILKEYNISRKSFYRIKNALNYPKAITSIIEELGPDKAELLNKIIELHQGQKNPQEIVKKYKNLKREELRVIYKELKKGKVDPKVKVQETAKGMNIAIKKQLPQEVKDYLNKIMDSIESDDYSFIKK